MALGCDCPRAAIVYSRHVAREMIASYLPPCFSFPFSPALPFGTVNCNGSCLLLWLIMVAREQIKKIKPPLIAILWNYWCWTTPPQARVTINSGYSTATKTKNHRKILKLWYLLERTQRQRFLLGDTLSVRKSCFVWKHLTPLCVCISVYCLFWIASTDKANTETDTSCSTNPSHLCDRF